MGVLLSLMDTLDSLLAWLNKIQGWPAVALVFASCIVIGYAWKFLPVKWFADESTPVIVILWGAFAQSMLADARPDGGSLRLWIVRNVLVGLVIGFFAWMLHNIVLKKIEDFLTAKFGGQADAPPPAVLPPPKP